MRKWKWLLLGGVVALVLLGVYLARPYPTQPPGPGVTWDNAEQIQPGMSAEEAKLIVGIPTQVETSSWGWDDLPPGTQTVMMWSDMDCDILVYLDRNRHVLGCVAVPPRPTHSWDKRLRKRLGF